MAFTSDPPPPGGQGFAGLVAALNFIAQNIARAVQALLNTFPQQATTITHTATTGPTDTLPAKPVGFLSITIAGVSYKVPLYLP